VHIGIDVGGTKIELAVLDSKLTIINAWRESTPTDDYARFITTVSNMVSNAEQEFGSEVTIGIGLPGMITPFGVTDCPNVPCLTGKTTVADVAASIGRPIGAGNDARNFVLSEANGGAGDGFDRVLGIILGSGVGGGLCINGKVSWGTNNIAGEWGHMLLPAVLQQRYDLPLRQCGCGASGCIEQYFSGPGLRWLFEHLTGRTFDSPVATDILLRGDEDAIRVADAYIDGLASCLSQLLIFYDPDIIVVGGGVSNEPELLKRLPDAFPDQPYAGKRVPEIVHAKFGDSSGVRGAAILGQRLKKRRIS
jgi:N-acetylglucosamine kinase